MHAERFRKYIHYIYIYVYKCGCACIFLVFGKSIQFNDFQIISVSQHILVVFKIIAGFPGVLHFDPKQKYIYTISFFTRTMLVYMYM